MSIYLERQLRGLTQLYISSVPAGTLPRKNTDINANVAVGRTRQAWLDRGSMGSNLFQIASPRQTRLRKRERRTREVRSRQKSRKGAEMECECVCVAQELAAPRQQRA